jgi:hypothetical protein
MDKFSKKDISKEGEVPERLPFQYDREPFDLADQHGKKEITKYSPEYLFLVKLVKLVTAEGVPPQEIKALAEAYPFQTVDDVGDLTAKIWTLATQKYSIPRDWLLQKFPKNASLKTAVDDKWQAQRETEDMINHAPGYIAYEYGQDKEAEGELQCPKCKSKNVGEYYAS